MMSAHLNEERVLPGGASIGATAPHSRQPTKRQRQVVRGKWRPCLVAIVGAATGSAGAQSVDLSPMQAAALDLLIDDIKKATRDAFASGDWSLLADVYPEGTFACWNASGEQHRYAFLSTEGIPEKAWYDVNPLPKDYAFGNVDASKMGGTHILTIAYEQALPSSCGLGMFRRWAQRDFYLKLEGEWFQLVHPCPTREQVEKREIVRTWPMIDRKHAAEFADRLSAEERATLRKLIKRDQFPVGALTALKTRHNVDEDLGILILDEVCKRNE